MTQALERATGGTVAVPQQGGGVVATPLDADTAAIGEVFRRLTLVVTLLEQFKSAISLQKDIGTRMTAELTVSADLMERLTATLGERISVDRLLRIAHLLGQLVEAGIALSNEAFDAIDQACRSNLEGKAALEAVYALGMDGGYGDTQRRAG